jgi:DNA segregation ATPase FtsK/SpoIIIE-like protein
VEAHPACLAASFVDDTYHILISGQSRAGKDTLALTMLLVLAVQYSPQAVQVCIIDGKGLDFVGFAGLAHTWRVVGGYRMVKIEMD